MIEGADGLKGSFLDSKRTQANSKLMTGTLENFELKFDFFGEQITTIDGQNFLTWFDLADPRLEATMGPTILCSQPRCRVGASKRPDYPDSEWTKQTSEMDCGFCLPGHRTKWRPCSKPAGTS